MKLRGISYDPSVCLSVCPSQTLGRIQYFRKGVRFGENIAIGMRALPQRGPVAEPGPWAYGKAF